MKNRLTHPKNLFVHHKGLTIFLIFSLTVKRTNKIKINYGACTFEVVNLFRKAMMNV